jgi:hypothetical protein
MKKEELFEDVRKLLNLKNTEFIIDPDIIESTCETYTEDGVTRCYLKSINDAIHEGVHAFFEERSLRLWKKLGEEEYISNLENIVTDENLEETTARLLEVNSQNISLDICSEDVQKTTRFMSEKTKPYENIELGKKITRLYTSIYDFNCVCPKDIEFYNDIKNDIDPIIIYNKLARYIGTDELI